MQGAPPEPAPDFRDVRSPAERVIRLAVTGSTSDDAVVALDGGASRVWVVADRQTAGRGRHGRIWASPPGNLHASVAMAEPCAPAIAPRLGFVAVLALHDALAAALPRGAEAALALKWPNDVLLSGRKCAGILLEGRRLADGRFAVVIGFGVNVASAPPLVDREAACIAELHAGVERDTVFEALRVSLQNRLDAFAAARHAFADLASAWTERAAGLGRVARVERAGGAIEGLFRGLDRDGRALLEAPDGLHAVDAGDFHIGPPAARAPHAKQSTQDAARTGEPGRAALPHDLQGQTL